MCLRICDFVCLRPRAPADIFTLHTAQFSPLGSDLQVKSGGAKDAEKHRQISQVRAKYLDQPASRCVGNQGICVATVKEEVIHIRERSNDEHRCRLDIHQNRREQENIHRPKASEVRHACFVSSLLAGPPSKLDYVCHQSKRDCDLNSMEQVYDRRGNVVCGNRKYRSDEDRPTSASNERRNSCT